MHPRIPFTLMLSGLLLSGCGPTNEEAARAVMMATPFVYGAGLGLMALMAFLWRKLDPDLGINWRPALIGLAAAGGVGLLSFVGVTDVPTTDPLNSTTNGIAGVAEWLPSALIAYGTSYLALLLVCWRIWLWLRPQTAFTWAYLPVLIMQLAPCPPMIFGLWEHHDEVWLLWILPGYVGMVTGPLFLIALIEVMVRILRRKKAARAQQSPSSP